MVITIVMEAKMGYGNDQVRDPADQEAPMWLVELNIAGYTIQRRAQRRRRLLGLPAPVLRQLASRPFGAA